MIVLYIYNKRYFNDILYSKRTIAIALVYLSIFTKQTFYFFQQFDGG